MKQPQNKPMPFCYGLLRGVGAGLLRLFFSYRRTGDPVPKEGPLLVVASHQGMLDFMTVAVALPGRLVRFIATRRFFRSRALRPFLRVDGAIPKTQFYPDPACIATVLRTLRAGGTVGLFPAGQTSTCGLPARVAPVVARLVKKAGAPVCAVRQHGGFYALPRFRTAKPCFGPVESEVRMLLTAEQLRTMSEEEIYRVLVDAIDFDEAAWQARTGARYRGDHRAVGLPQALWKCPRCGAEFALRGEKSVLRCGRCGAAAALGTDMRFSEGFPATVTDWYRWQEEALRQQLKAPEFALESRAEALSWDGARFLSHGTGLLRLDRTEITWTGTWDGEAAAFSAPHKDLAGLTVASGAFMELYAPGRGLVRLHPKDPSVLGKWKQTQEYLHRIAEEA